MLSGRFILQRQKGFLGSSRLISDISEKFSCQYLYKAIEANNQTQRSFNESISD